VRCASFGMTVRATTNHQYSLSVPAGGGAGGGLDFGALKRLEDQTHSAGAHGQWHGLFENRAQGLSVCFICLKNTSISQRHR